MAKLAIVIDCRDPHALSRFWTMTLGYLPFGQAGPYRSIVPVEHEPGPKIIFQAVPEARTSKNRLHLDVFVADIDTEVDRLLAYSARRVSGLIEEAGSSWVVMADPEDNEFCICKE